MMTHEKHFTSDDRSLPAPFIIARLHSLLGVWLVIYLFEHLLVNSQMALMFEDDGHAFISMVNKIHALPYLKVIEILFLGVPFLIHGVWGIAILRTAKLSSFRRNKAEPTLPYRRNHAYSWQRITSWVLLVGIILHVFQMRFLDYPSLT